MKLLYEILREFISFVWYVVTSLLGVFLPHKNPPKDSKQSILIVPGIGSQPCAFFFLQKYLEKKNFSVYFFPATLLQTFGIGYASIDEIAEKIQSFVVTHNLKNSVILSMSGGSLPTLVYLEKYHGWQYVAKHISVAGAFKGGWLSYVLFLLPLSRMLRPHVLSQLYQEYIPLLHPERTISLVGKWDEFVTKNSSSLPKIKSYYTLPDGGHAFLQTFSEETFAIIAKEATLLK